MTINALVIQPDGATEVVETATHFEDFRRLIGGGWLEGVGASIGDDWTGYCDEEGRLKGLPVNEKATALARALGWPGDFLVGAVVFVGLDHRGEDGAVEVDVPQRIIEAVGH